MMIKCDKCEESVVKEEKVYYRYGDTLKVLTSLGTIVYGMIVQVSENNIVFVDLADGNRWKDPKSVKDAVYISSDELYRILPPGWGAMKKVNIKYCVEE